jgi:hypothetical protein
MPLNRNCRTALEEAAGDLIADLNPRDASTDLHHLAGTIGQRDVI